MRALLSRLKVLFLGRGTSLAELDDELASHIDMLAEQYERKGMEPAEARRIAQNRLGPAGSIRETHYETLGIPFFDALMQDLRYGIRMLRRDRSFTLGVVLTLGLGIGVTTAVFTLVDALLLSTLPYQNAGELILMNRLPIFDFVESRPKFQEWKRGSTLLADAALYAESQVNVEGGAQAMHVHLAQVTANLPSVLGAEPLLGRTFAPDEDVPHGPHVAMISARLWRDLFQSDPAAIGKPLAINAMNYTVIGILPPRFDFPAATDVWTPSGHAEESLEQFGATMGFLLARMKPGITTAQIAAQQKSVFGKQFKGLDQDVMHMFGGMRFEQPPIAKSLRDQLSGQSDKDVLLLFGSVCMILLIACANIANLVLSRMVTREREFAVRRALGVSNGRLLRQIFTEQVLAGALGGVVGIGVAYAALPLLATLLPDDWPSYATVHIGLRVLAFSVGISFLAGLGTALAPALRLLRRAPGAGVALGHGNRLSESGGHQRWRDLLVGAETAIAMMLLAGTGVLVQSFVHIVGIDPGFHPGHLLTFTVSRPDAHDQKANSASIFYRQALERLGSLPGVRTTGAIDFLPLRPKTTIAIVPVKRDPSDRGEPSSMRTVTAGYFRTMQIPLLAGRDFAERDDKRAEPVAIVSDVLASRMWPGQSALGQRVYIGNRKPANVVGVVGAVRFFGPRSNPLPEIYFPYTRTTPDKFSFVMRTSGSTTALASEARKAIHDISPLQPIDEIATMDDYWTRSMSHERSLTALASIFTFLGTALAIVGIYALISYSVKCREREFGIRLTLGARPGALLTGSVTRAMFWVLPGIVAGTGLAFAARRIIESELFEVKSWQPGLTATLGCALLFVSALAGLIGARRAAVLDPARLLRWE